MMWYILATLFILVCLFFHGIFRLIEWSDRCGNTKPDRLTDEEWREVLIERADRQARRERIG